MVRSFLSMILFMLLASPCQAQAKSTASPEQHRIAYQTIAEKSITLSPEITYRLVHQNSQAFYIRLSAPENEIVAIRKTTESAEAFHIGQKTLQVEVPYSFSTQRNYFIFSPGQQYDIVEQKGEKWVLRYPTGKDSKLITISKKGFTAAADKKEQLRVKAPTAIEKPQDAICIIEAKDSRGTGFIFNRGFHSYCYTNQHVILTPHPFKIKRIDGTVLEYDKVEFANDRDLARIRLREAQAGFYRSRMPELEETVTVLGNSQGTGRITSLKGKVIGIGADEMETDAKFVSGNSGSPIFSKHLEVLGVATYVEKLPGNAHITKGTPFEEGRRVGVMLESDIEWLEQDLDKIRVKNRQFYKVMSFANEIFPVAGILYRVSVNKRIRYEAVTHLKLKHLIKSRNYQMESKWQAFKNYSSEWEQRDVNYKRKPSYKKALKKHLEDLDQARMQSLLSLTTAVRNHKNMAKRLPPIPDTEFTRQRKEQLVTKLQHAEKILKLVTKGAHQK